MRLESHFPKILRLADSPKPKREGEWLIAESID